MRKVSTCILLLTVSQKGQRESTCKPMPTNGSDCAGPQPTNEPHQLLPGPPLRSPKISTTLNEKDAGFPEPKRVYREIELASWQAQDRKSSRARVVTFPIDVSRLEHTHTLDDLVVDRCLGTSFGLRQLRAYLLPHDSLF